MIKTKNNSIFKDRSVSISRKDYDLLASKDSSFLQRLFETYRRSWSLCGVRFFDVNIKDCLRVYKLLS